MPTEKSRTKANKLVLEGFEGLRGFEIAQTIISEFRSRAKTRFRRVILGSQLMGNASPMFASDSSALVRGL